MWYSLTGCDSVSSFNGKGKKSAWETWKSYPDATEAFKDLSSPEDGNLSEISVSIIERFVCLLYDRTTIITNVDECRRMLFTKKGRTVDSIPPTKDALLQHIKRAVYQAG